MLGYQCEIGKFYKLLSKERDTDVYCTWFIRCMGIFRKSVITSGYAMIGV